ncbi:MAG: hypothetical protein PHV78_00215 [Patescibacteria group bacterium]|nr:hypothetical protein [Patescibacteria group bacterium]MDD5121401.1 hypothetical protein [Patescibacteria group bacterium]MDD5221873.1 hypothetical protein [Patescibacteria group bacterium]MDD5395680.1 hypothetical protein [Patescibacteria group bacterium]
MFNPFRKHEAVSSPENTVRRPEPNIVPWYKVPREKRVETIARSFAAVRMEVEASGKVFDYKTIGSLNKDAQPTKRDYEAAEEWIAKEEAKDQKFLDDLRASAKVGVPCRAFVFPEYNSVHIPSGGPGKIKTMQVEKLFLLLGIPEEKLKEVYEFGDLGELRGIEADKGKVGFTGSFTEDGKQRLANILGKQIEFSRSFPPDNQIEAGSQEIFNPEKE